MGRSATRSPPFRSPERLNAAVGSPRPQVGSSRTCAAARAGRICFVIGIPIPAMFARSTKTLTSRIAKLPWCERLFPPDFFHGSGRLDSVRDYKGDRSAFAPLRTEAAVMYSPTVPLLAATPPPLPELLLVDAEEVTARYVAPLREKFRVT